MSAKTRVAILGATGYGGSELLRLLLAHPHVAVTRVTSRQQAGVPVHKVHPHLLRHTDLVFEDPPSEKVADGIDVVFSALPHTASMAAIKALPDSVRIIDLSGDFRLETAAGYEAAYGHAHVAPQLLGQFVYGLTEFARERIRNTRCVANPGCFATAVALALIPLAKEGLLDGPVSVVGVTGSSGSGVEPKASTHHPERAQAFRAYKPLVHQHLPEIVQTVAHLTGVSPRIAFVPHSAPLVRGIHATVIAHPRRAVSAGEVRAMLDRSYGAEPFVRVVDSPPDVAVVAGSNHADLYGHAENGAVVILCALDNLVKGMAGQAVQNLNVMMRWPEHVGLDFPGMRP